MGMFDRKRDRLAVDLDREVKDDFKVLCHNRGLSEEQMFTVMLRSFTRRKVVFAHDDTINFGKYNGLIVEDVIRADPRYVSWLLRESQWFRLSTHAEWLLDSMGEED